MAAEDTTALQALEQLIDEQRGMGRKLTVSTSSASNDVTTSDANMAQLGANADRSRFGGRFLFIPIAAAAGDKVRTVKKVTIAEATGVVTIDTIGGNYGETLADKDAYLLPIHPDDILRLFNDGLGLEYNRLLTNTRSILYQGPDDADVQGGDTTFWPNTSGVTMTKDETTAHVFLGQRVLLGTNAGFSRSSLVRLGLDEGAVAHFIAKARDADGGQLVVEDQANAELVDVPFTNADWIYGEKTVAKAPARRGLYLVAKTVGAAGKVDWQSLWVSRQDYRYYDLPAWIRKEGELRGIAVLLPGKPAYEADTWLLGDCQFKMLDKGSDYSVDINEADERPYQITITNDEYLGKPLFVLGRVPFGRAYGGSLTFGTSWSATTPAPKNLLVAAARVLLGKRYGNERRFTNAVAGGEDVLAEELIENTTSLPPRRAPNIGGVLNRGR